MSDFIDYSKFTEVPYEEKPAIIETTIDVPNIDIPSNEITLFEQVCEQFSGYEPEEMTLMDLISNEYTLPTTNQECYDICLNIEDYAQIPYIDVLSKDILNDYLNGNCVLFFSFHNEQGFIYYSGYNSSDMKTYDALIKWENPTELSKDEGAIISFSKNGKLCFYKFNNLKKKLNDKEIYIFDVRDVDFKVLDLNGNEVYQNTITSGFIFEKIYLDYYTNNYIYNFSLINKEYAFFLINAYFENKGVIESKDLIVSKETTIEVSLTPIIDVSKPSITKSIDNMNFLLCSDNFDFQNCIINYKVSNLIPRKSYRLYFDIGSFASIDSNSRDDYQHDYVQISIGDNNEKYTFNLDANYCENRTISNSQVDVFDSTQIGKVLPGQNEGWSRCGYINHLYIDFNASNEIEEGYIQLVTDQRYYDEAWALLENGWKIEEIEGIQSSIYYNFDNNVNDVYGNFNGRWIGTPTYVNTLNNQGILCDANNYVELYSGDVSNFFKNDKIYSISFYTKILSNGLFFFISDYDSDDHDYDFYCDFRYNSGTLQWEIRKNGSDILNLTYNVDLTDDFHHIVITSDGNVGKLYVDKSLKQTSNFTSSDNLGSIDGVVRLGVHRYKNGPETNTSGIIDELKIFDKTLNEDEVSSL